MELPIQLIVKVQQFEDKRIEAKASWNIKELKGKLSEIYPTVSIKCRQNLLDWEKILWCRRVDLDLKALKSNIIIWVSSLQPVLHHKTSTTTLMRKKTNI